MPLTVVLLCGPSGAGKTTLARVCIEEVLPKRPHYVRLYPIGDHGSGQQPLVNLTDWKGVRSATGVPYAADRVFEVLPDVLVRIRKRQRFATVLVEGDADPCLRHAYPYEKRFFVMPAVDDVYSVFRRPEEASASLKQVMEDTAEFASEIFGLFEDGLWDDEEGVRHQKGLRSTHGVREELDISETQVTRFLASPLGAEIAARIQLRPAYHPLVEADVVVVNMGVGACTAAVDACIRRLEALLTRLQGAATRENTLYCCDLLNKSDPQRQRLVRRMAELLLEV
jgi:hypothetical protein